MKYPKLWNGASPLGEALVRALNKSDVPFLSAYAGGITASKSGNYREVRGGVESEFFSQGYIVKNGESALKHKGFAKTEKVAKLEADVSGEYLGHNRFIGHLTPVKKEATIPGTESVLGTWDWPQAFSVKKRGKKGYVVTAASKIIVIKFNSGAGYYSSGRTAHGGAFEVDKKPENYLVTVRSFQDGVDLNGVPRFVPIFDVMLFNASTSRTSGFPIPNAAEKAQFPVPSSMACVTPGKWVFLIANFYTPKIGVPRNLDGHTQAGLYMYMTDNAGESWYIKNITPLMNGLLPNPGNSTNKADFYSYGHQVNYSILNMVTDAVWAVFSPSVFMCVTGYVRGNEFYAIAFRTTTGGASWVKTPIPAIPGATFSYQRLYNITVYGAEKAILKRRVGLFGSPANVEFLRTEDAGATWSRFVPQGLPSLDSYDVGQINAFVSAEQSPDGEDGFLTVTAWEDLEKRYAVYASKDGGFTWRYHASLGRSERKERRLDYIKAADDPVRPSSFEELRWIGTRAHPRPADNINPWRYDYKYPPP